MSSSTVLNLDPRDYPGGIAIWGAMPPVLDTTRRAPESGVHVHARKCPGKKKEIDETFDRVNVTVAEGNEELILAIDGTIAQAFNVAEILGLPIDTLKCPSCGVAHLDIDIAAVTPHSIHQCDSCGCRFRSANPVISNPLSLLRAKLQGCTPTRMPVQSTRTWRHKMRDWSEGVQVWGSNGAILWTAERPEESGIHIHAFNAPSGLGVRLADETFGKVEIDGFILDAHQIRFLMAQLASDSLRPYVDSITCPHCDYPHMEDQMPAIPSIFHICSRCGHGFTTERPIISNPAKIQMAHLQSIGDRDNGNS